VLQNLQSITRFIEPVKWGIDTNWLKQAFYKKFQTKPMRFFLLTPLIQIEKLNRNHLLTLKHYAATKCFLDQCKNDL